MNIIFRSFWKSSVRTLLNAKLNTSISLLGLCVGFLASIILFQYNTYENSFDNFHSDGNRIFRIIDSFSNATTSNIRATSFYSVAETLKSELPEVEASTSFIMTNCVMTNGDHKFREEKIVLARKSYFEIFSVPFIEGGFDELDEVNSILLSRSLATKYFGPNNALGELIEIDNFLGNSFTGKVTGIFEDLPPNTHLKGDAFVSMNKSVEFVNSGKAFGSGVTMESVAWRLMGYYTYIKVKEHVDIDALDIKISKLVNQYRKDLNIQLNQKHELFTQPLVAIHKTPGYQSELSPTVNKKVLNSFYIIAGLILIMAWINYVNLATARAVNRAKEIGMRKVLGAHKSQLIVQFLFESLILSISAWVVTMVLIGTSARSIEVVLGKDIFFNPIQNLFVVVASFVIIIIGSIISAIYPAFVLTSYNPLRVLKGRIQFSESGVMLRKGLVFVQFFVAIGLLSALLVINSQLNFMINNDIGANINQTIMIPLPVLESPDHNRSSNLKVLKDELSSSPEIAAIALSSVVPGVQNLLKGTAEIIVDGNKRNIYSNFGLMDQHYIDLFELKIIAGRKYSDEFTGDKNVCIINRKAADEFGFKSPEDAIDQELEFGYNSRRIVGVMENFSLQGLQNAQEPLIMALDTALSSNYLNVKLKTGNVEPILQLVKAKFTSLFPNYPYEYSFLDETFKAQYSEDKKFEYVFALFATVAIFIAALGSLGLSAYMASQKQKEVSIRKVLGSDNLKIFMLLNREYVILSSISFVVTVPIVYYFMKVWLSSYHTRISIDLWVFIIPYFLIQLIVLLVTTSQTYKTAMSNPARTLREQ